MKEGNYINNDETWISEYYKILSRYSTQINVIILFLILTTVLSLFTGYSSQFGSLEFAQEREKKTLEAKEKELKVNKNRIDSLGKRGLASSLFDTLNRRHPLNTADSLRLKNLSDQRENLLRDSSTAVNSLRKVDKLVDEITISQIPLFGEKTSRADYIFFLYLLSIGALFWLLTILEFTKNVLKEVFNYPSTKDNSYEISIPSLFYIILPSNDNLKFYRYFELILYCFFASILLIGIIICYELFIFHSEHNSALTKIPGFDESQVFWTIGLYIIFALIYLMFFFFILPRLKDIRNLLILIKWQRTAFFPKLYELFQENNLYLIKGQNRMEYRQVGISSKLELCIYANVYNPTNPKDIRFIHDTVNLPKSLCKYISFNKTEVYDRTFFIDKYLDRIITVEEFRMREFFKALLTDKGYDNGIANSYGTALLINKISAPEVSNVVEKISKDIYEQVIELIKDNRINEVFALIDKNVVEDSNERKEQIALIKMRYDRYNSHFIKGIIPIDTYELEMRTISNNILEFIKVYR